MGIIYKNGIAYGNQPNGTVPSGGTTGQVLKKASNTDYDTEWANESGGGGGTSDIAEEYDPTSGVYSVGDYCIYQTVLYKCITAISTPEAFDSSKWSEVTVGDELNGVKNTLNQLDQNMAYVESGNTASRTYASADFISWKGADGPFYPITFPMTFSSSSRNIYLTEQSAGVVFRVPAISNTGCTAMVLSGTFTGTQDVAWLAIGRWK